MSLKPVQTNLLKYSLSLGLIFLSLAAVSYFFMDHSLSLFFNNDDLMPYRRMARALTDLGLGENSFLLAIASFLFFHFGDKSWRRRTLFGHEWGWLRAWSLNYFFALIFSGLTGNLIKFLVGRQRPHVSDTFDAHLFSPFSFDSYNQSLPSGHAQVFFCSATMLAILWPRRAWLIYPIFALLAFTRVMVHAHFLSDVITGGLVGHLATLWCLWLLQKYYPARYSLSSRRL